MEWDTIYSYMTKNLLFDGKGPRSLEESGVGRCRWPRGPGKHNDVERLPVGVCRYFCEAKGDSFGVEANGDWNEVQHRVTLPEGQCQEPPMVEPTLGLG